MQLTRYFLAAIQIVHIKFNNLISTLCTKILFSLGGIKYKKIHSTGIPFIHISRNALVIIGNNFTMGNSILNSATGIKGKCKIDVRNQAQLIIGNDVGMTLASISCFQKISIGNNVKIGFGTHIMDTDFHAISTAQRNSPYDQEHALKKPITIKDNAFIGAHCIILKGVTIGENAVIAAGSVVTHDVPDNTIAGGNPCKIIRYQKNQ